LFLAHPLSKRTLRQLLSLSDRLDTVSDTLPDSRDGVGMAKNLVPEFIG
jgi:hypothetical protein